MPRELLESPCGSPDYARRRPMGLPIIKPTMQFKHLPSAAVVATNRQPKQTASQMIIEDKLRRLSVTFAPDVSVERDEALWSSRRAREMFVSNTARFRLLSLPVPAVDNTAAAAADVEVASSGSSNTISVLLNYDASNELSDEDEPATGDEPAWLVSFIPRWSAPPRRAPLSGVSSIASDTDDALSLASSVVGESSRRPLRHLTPSASVEEVRRRSSPVARRRGTVSTDGPLLSRASLTRQCIAMACAAVRSPPRTTSRCSVFSSNPVSAQALSLRVFHAARIASPVVRGAHDRRSHRTTPPVARQPSRGPTDDIVRCAAHPRSRAKSPPLVRSPYPFAIIEPVSSAARRAAEGDEDGQSVKYALMTVKTKPLDSYVLRRSGAAVTRSSVDPAVSARRSSAVAHEVVVSRQPSVAADVSVIRRSATVRDVPVSRLSSVADGVSVIRPSVPASLPFVGRSVQTGHQPLSNIVHVTYLPDVFATYSFLLNRIRRAHASHRRRDGVMTAATHAAPTSPMPATLPALMQPKEATLAASLSPKEALLPAPMSPGKRRQFARPHFCSNYRQLAAVDNDAFVSVGRCILHGDDLGGTNTRHGAQPERV